MIAIYKMMKYSVLAYLSLAHLFVLGEATKLLLIISSNNTYQRRRIQELHEAFREDFLVVWDNHANPKCPYTDIASCVGDISVTKAQQWIPRDSHAVGLEKAAMWAIAHRHSFDHVWMMEDDVYYTNIRVLKHVIRTSSRADLLTSQPLSWNDTWPWHGMIRRQTSRSVEAKHYPAVHTMLNLYRMSSTLVDRIVRTYIQNHRIFFFFEAMIPTLALYYNLTHDIWTDLHRLPRALLWRPCHKTFKKPGLYHPVKWKDGRFLEC